MIMHYTHIWSYDPRIISNQASCVDYWMDENEPELVRELAMDGVSQPQLRHTIMHIWSHDHALYPYMAI